MKKNLNVIRWVSVIGLMVIAAGATFILSSRSPSKHNDGLQNTQPSAFADSVKATGTVGKIHKLTSVQSEIDKVFQNSYDGINRGDVDAYTADLSTDYRWNGPKGQAFIKKQFADTVRKDLTVSKNMRATIEITSMKIRDKVATVNYQKNLKFDVPGLNTRFIFDTPGEDQLEQRNGQWKVVSTRILSERVSHSPI